jgi:hypothetical protein
VRFFVFAIVAALAFAPRANAQSGPFAHDRDFPKIDHGVWYMIGELSHVVCQEGISPGEYLNKFVSDGYNAGWRSGPREPDGEIRIVNVIEFDIENGKRANITYVMFFRNDNTCADYADRILHRGMADFFK